jgi:hypothetical protein
MVRIPIIRQNSFKKHTTLLVSFSETQRDLTINYSAKSFKKTKRDLTYQLFKRSTKGDSSKELVLYSNIV